MVIKSIKKKEKTHLSRKIGHNRPIRLSEPRIPPLDKSKWDKDVKERIERRNEVRDGPVPNIITTIANHSKLFKRWSVFANHVLQKSSLPPRDREILILRIGWLCRAEYEWGHHVVIGKEASLTDEEIRRITEGPDVEGWDPFDATLLRAVDELYVDSFIGDATWGALAKKYSTHQLLDVIFTVGQYNIVCMALNTLGVQIEEGFEGFPK